MLFILLASYIFFAQFPSLIKIGSSYIGIQLLILPFCYLYVLKIRKLINYILPLCFISLLIGFLRYSQINYSEIILRLIGIGTVISSVILPIALYKKSGSLKKFIAKYLKTLLIITIPNLLFCLFELVYRFTSIGKVYESLSLMKDKIFVPGRGTQVIGTISGLFPEHGLFAPFLLFLLGMSFLFIGQHKKKPAYLIAISWILISLFHSSGLFFASLILTFLIFIILYLISISQKLTISSKSIKYFLFLTPIILIIIFISQFTHPFIFKRFSEIFENFDINLIAVLDKSLGYKLLPYYVLSKTSLIDLFIGSGLGSFSQLVLSKISDLPYFFIENDYFKQNFRFGRFPLNSTLICSILEYGLVIWLSIIYLMRKAIKFFRPIHIFIDFSNILRYKFQLNEILSFIFFTASFLSIFGPVPLSYPFPFLSLSFMFILFDSKCKNI